MVKGKEGKREVGDKKGREGIEEEGRGEGADNCVTFVYVLVFCCCVVMAGWDSPLLTSVIRPSFFVLYSSFPFS